DECRLLICRHRPRLSLSAAKIIYLPAERLQCRVIIDIFKLYLDPELFGDAIDDLRAVQRASAQLEVVVVRTERLELENFAPDCPYLLLGLGRAIVRDKPVNFLLGLRRGRRGSLRELQSLEL